MTEWVWMYICVYVFVVAMWCKNSIWFFFVYEEAFESCLLACDYSLSSDCVRLLFFLLVVFSISISFSCLLAHSRALYITFTPRFNVYVFVSPCCAAFMNETLFSVYRKLKMKANVRHQLKYTQHRHFLFVWRQQKTA